MDQIRVPIATVARTLADKLAGEEFLTLPEIRFASRTIRTPVGAAPGSRPS